MQINRTKINNSNNYHFKGRVELRTQAYFDDIIRKLDACELRDAEKNLNRVEATPKKRTQKPLLSRITSIFLSQEPQAPIQTLAIKKSLSNHWGDTLSTLKKLVELKLPDDYILKTKRSDLGSKFIMLQLFKGDKYTFGLHTSIKNPKFATELMEQAVIEIKNGRDPLKLSGYKHQWKKD